MKMALCDALFHLGTLIATMVIKDKLMIVEPGHDNGSPRHRWNNFAPLKLLSMQCRIIHLQPIICTTTFNSSYLVLSE